MRVNKWWPFLIVAASLLVCFVAALLLRIVLPYKDVFTSNGVVFTGNDAYYQMRLVESFVHNFPRLQGVDPYLAFPGTGWNVVPSFFQWMLGVLIWIVGLGSPTEHTINAVGAYFPAILGAITVIPAFFIGRELWGKHGNWAGIVAAALVAVLPGEFLGRSILGFTDQHVAETLLSTTAILFLIKAIKSARLAGISWGDVRYWRWIKLRRTMLFIGLTGLFLYSYIYAWQGALLVVFAVGVFFVLQFLIDHLKGRPTDYLSVTGTLLFAFTLVLFWLLTPASVHSNAAYRLYVPSLFAAILITIAMGAISYFMAHRHLSRVLYPVTVVVLGGLGLGLLYLIDSSFVRSAFTAFSVFAPSGTLLATVEAQSIFTPLTAGGGFLDSPAWINFYFALPFAFLGLLILILYSVIRQGNSEKCAFVVWSLVMMVATIGQRRFAYYFAVNVALLAGYVSVLIYYLITWVLAYTGGDRSRSMSSSVLDLEGLRGAPVSVAETVEAATRRERRRERQQARRRELQRRRMNRQQNRASNAVREYVGLGLSVVVVFMLLFSQLVLFPDPAHGLTTPPTLATAGSTPYAPSDAWMKSMAWMRSNTPEPLGSADAYYANHPAGKSYVYPESAYGVTAWWDYGYWITYIAHRMPSANPSQDPAPVKKVAAFLVSQNETAATVIADQMQTSYVVMDYQTATSKFWAVATWADKSPNDFFEVFYDPQAKQQKLFIYPTYYQSMATRLYSFNGTAQAGLNPTVVQYAVRTTKQGSYKEIVTQQSFPTYTEASTFMSSQSSGNYVIVGTDPLVSPVPLEALQHYKLVYASDNKVAISSAAQTPEIEIFERSR